MEKKERGAILKSLREEKNLRQADLADFLEISQQAYQRYENGTSEPNGDGFIKLADFYNVSTDYLLGRTEVREMNRLSADALTEEQVREIDDAIVSSYERLPLESRRAFIKMLEDLFGNIFDREDYGMDEYEDLAEDPQDSTA